MQIHMKILYWFCIGSKLPLNFAIPLQFSLLKSRVKGIDFKLWILIMAK